MTRINVGMAPAELCDQHLIAEYRELPRLFGRTSHNPAPERFTLGKGHVLWCQQFQGSLTTRHHTLAAEMKLRGFKAYWTSALLEPDARYWTAEDEAYARPIVKVRIVDRLSTMKRTPRWTGREAPDWAVCNKKSP